ncbi:MAG TPA: ABC transporter permease subunit [Fimbriimonadaceae bacterium]|nr:ABC transporter permease subunit [Fimbriimonadaceae bacterium]
MNFFAWRAIARGVMLESLRRKDLWVVAILGFLILISAGALGFFGVRGLEVFAKDLAVTVLGLFSTVVAVMTTTRLLPDEIKNRTLYPLLARPITRFDLLAGKLLGATLVSWTAFLLLAALSAVALASFHVRFEPVMLQYLLAKMMGLVVLCSVSLMLSTFMTPAAAATMSLALAFGSSMIVRGLLMAYSDSGPAMQWTFKLLNSILPQYNLFDLGSRAANIGWATVPLWVIASLAVYMIVYSSGTLGLAWSKFRKQAL